MWGALASLEPPGLEPRFWGFAKNKIKKKQRVRRAPDPLSGQLCCKRKGRIPCAEHEGPRAGGGLGGRWFLFYVAHTEAGKFRGTCSRPEILMENAKIPD